MSHVIDKRARNIGLGLAGLTTAVLGIAWLRNRRSPPCKVVEESVYRGFSYRIESCGEFFLPMIRVEVGQTLANLEHSRQWVQLMVDQKLMPALENTFVGPIES